MKHLAKRTLSLLLAALMVLSLIPASNHVHAAEITTAYYGADNTKDANLTTSAELSYGTIKNYVSTHSAWAIKSGGMGLVLSEAFREGFDGKATVEVEYLNAFAAVFDLQYIANDGTVKTATEYTTKTGTSLSSQAATIRVYELTDMGTTTDTIGSVPVACSVAVTTTSTSYVGIRSIRVTKASAESALEPEFNEADFTANSGYVFDELASPALTIKNPDDTVAMTARVYVTLKKDGVDVEGLVQKRLLNGEVPTAEAFELISSDTMTNSTKAVGTYQVVVNSFITVDGGDEYQVDKTFTFQRRNTFTQRYYEENGDLYYAVQVVTGAESVCPNNFRITITGGDLVEPKVVNAQGYAYGTDAETVKNLTKDVMSDLAYGAYTVKIEAYKGGTLRATKSYQYTIVAPPAFAPEYGTISTVLDKASVPALTIKNTSETSEMTTAIKATLKLNGELHPNVQNVSVGPETPVAAGETATLISADLLSKYATAMGNWEIILTGTVTVDEVSYEVNETITFSRVETFTHEVVEVEGNVYYSAKAVSEEAVAYAPNGAKASVIDAEDNTIVGPTSMPITLTTEGIAVNLKELIKDLDYGTYTIKVEAYRNSELRGTTEYTYTIVAPPAFAPEYGTISTVLDKAAVPALTITNTSETSEMTTAIKATLKLDGVLHPNVQNVSVGPETPVAAGETATLISADLLSKYATAMGNWEIILTGTVTVDEVSYEVNETITFSRVATFTHEVVVVDGNVYYSAKAVSEEAVAYAPNGVKIYVENAEGQTLAGPSNQAIAVTVEGIQSKLNGMGIIANLEPGTYVIKVEAYRNSELRGTTTCEYTVAPECEHSSVTNGDCTATTTATCPDCQETVTVQADHTYEDDNDCTTAHNCSICGNEAVAAKGHDYTDEQDASCNNKGCNYVRYIHYGSNVTLGNSIDVNVTVSIPAGEKEQHKAYVQVAGGEKVEVELTQNGTNFCDVTLPGLAAKDLYKEINVTVCDENGVEVHNVTESFAAYAERLFASEANDNDKKMIADMVAYAVAAQNYFLKNTNNSVIAQLEEAGVDYTLYTDNANPTCTDERAFTGNRSLVQGTNFDLEDEISMNMYVRDVDYAVIEYIPYNSNEKVSETIQASECVKSGDYYKFKIPGYVTADGACTVVTAKFFVNGNDEPVVTVTDSMASYVARQGASLTWLYTMQKYANSAYAALTD